MATSTLSSPPAAAGPGPDGANKACRQAASEGEYEEEEFYVVATLPANALEQARGGSQQPHYALVDIDSDRPMLELEGAIYQGTNDELLGTAMLFDVTEDADARLVGTTSRVVAFRPVQVTRKG